MIKYSPSKILASIIGLLVVPLYTRILSPEQFGLYHISVATLSFICIIFSDWVGIAALRFFKENKILSTVNSYFGTLILIITINLTIMFVLGFISFNNICNYFKIPSNLLYIVLFLIPPVAIRCLLSQVLRAQIKPVSYTTAIIFNQISTTVISVFFIYYFKMGAEAILYGMAVSIILTDAIMAIQSGINTSTCFKTVKTSTLSSYYRYGVPIALSSLGMWLIGQGNRFILQHYKGSFFSGILGVGYNLTFSAIMPLLTIITLAAVPRIYERYESGIETGKALTRLTGLYISLATPITFMFCLFPKQIVDLFSNKNYAEAHIILPFLALSMFALGLSEYTTIQYHLAKKTFIETGIRILPGISGLILGIILIPKYGLYGVGISTLTSYGLYFLLSITVNIRGLEWKPPYKVIRSTIFSMFLSVVIYYLLYTKIPSLELMISVLVSYIIIQCVQLTILKFKND